VSVDFYCVATDDHLQRSGCNIKVFKDKGGDRKQKQDNQKVEKLSPSERSMNRPSQDVTRFSVFSVVSQGKHSPPPFSVHSSPSSQSNPCASSLTPSATLNVLSSVTDVHQWLTARHFSSDLSLFANYSGADLLRLSRQDLRELCGAADGIRLFNALHSQSLCTVYVCLENKTVYQALSLELLTAAEFIAKLTEKVGLKQNEVSSVIQLTNSGILVLVDDTVQL
jgi:transcription factor CP2-like protein